MASHPDPNRTIPSSPAIGGYKLFVAWRYLLVTPRKIQPQAHRLLFAGLAALGLIALLPALHLEPDTTMLRNPMWVAEVVAGLFVTMVVFFGVLPHSKPALIIALVGVAAFVPSFAGYLVLTYARLPFVHLDPEQLTSLKQLVTIIAIVGAGIAVIAMFFGTLRIHFTFFTTVPI